MYKEVSPLKWPIIWFSLFIKLWSTYSQVFVLFWYLVHNMKDLDNVAMDELHGIHIAYEIREMNKKSIKEISNIQIFKEDKEHITQIKW